MSLSPGTRLGSYQVTAPLGQGGMGEVYRATDTTLGRSVAIKILPESFAFDSERLARFEREARTLAALNHPNIAQVYGYESVNPSTGPGQAVRVLIMELVEGPTLADRIAEGPIPTEEALAIARQMATALEVAHDAGIVHRDLKPANVKVRPDGTVKVLDFGLAKTAEPVATSTELSPTITSPALTTGAGVLLGTAGYMSPEQARGKAVDKRADIWAFGAVLYEMLTGDRLWAGETNLDVLAQVVHKEPDFENVPAQLKPLLRRCLEKDPRKRLRDISGVELLLEQPWAVASSPSRPGVAAWMVAGVLAVALAAVTWSLWPEPAPDRVASRFSIDAPPDAAFTFVFPGAAISRDGRLLVFAAQGRGNSMLWLRPADSLDAHELPGTENGNHPFWSPDGKSIGFWSQTERQLKRTEAIGGAPQTLCEAPAFEGGTWSGKGVILFSSAGTIHQVPANGGSCSAVTKPADGERHTAPQFLPDGRAFLFVLRSNDSNVEGVYASSLDRPDQRTKLLNTDTKALYAPPYDGHPGFLLWLRGERTLVAQRFDPDALKLEGEPVTLADQIRVGGGGTGPDGVRANRAAFWVTDNGLLMYRSGGGAGRALAWISRDGKRLETVVQEQRAGELVNTIRLSPDGTRMVVERVVDDVSDMWIYEIPRRVWSRLTATPDREGNPAWSPDGRTIAFTGVRDGIGQIVRMDANGGGPEQVLTAGPNTKVLMDWSKDGRYLLYSEVRENQRDLFILPLDGPDRAAGKPIPFLTTPANEPTARFSPDGKWIAYVSDATGQAEAYIRAFPGGPSGQWPVSSSGAAVPVFRGNGGELFYRVPNRGRGGSVNAVPIRFHADRPEIGATQTVLTGGFLIDTANVSDDGQRFLVLTEPSETTDSDRNPLTVVLNWQSALK